ncbi:hypothetical protein [Salinarchaeum laminariae]|uniref:hypothetical protein n=1 Tax=Salinarchaeum laminariae TaxID=869888 RepID=UPI0020C0DAEE|nr:hypothetical protein [Salinarchaeum laminariae]
MGVARWAVLELGYALQSIASTGGNRRAATRYAGTAAGVAAATMLIMSSEPVPSIDVDLLTLGPVLFGVCFAIYIVHGENDRWRLPGAPSARNSSLSTFGR